MKAAENKVVAVSYELEVEGQIADKAPSERPLEYIHGTGMLLPKFEANIVGKEPGDTFEFVLTPEEGYGTRSEEYIFDLPKNAFELDGVVREDLLVIGNVIPMLNNAGQVVQGTVAAVGEDTVTMDFNHPMAGKTLHFTGKVEAVRDATMKELSEGLHHCNCHKGDCNGDCGEGKCGGCE